MGKKIVVLNGSPRLKGNTSALIEAFTKGAQQAGHSVTTFALDKMNIIGCKGCMRGGKDKASPCVQKDDMDTLYPVYTEADVVVLASPLYYWRWSGQLNTALDRLYAVAEAAGGDLGPKKDCVLLMAAGGTDDDFALISQYYDTLNGYLGWNSLGKVLAGGVMEIGDIAGKPELEQAEKLGASI